MNAKDRNWRRFTALEVAGLGVPTLALVWLHEALPRWIFVGWGLLFITIIVATPILLVFGPRTFRERFPAALRPMMKLWLAFMGFSILAVVVDGTMKDVVPEALRVGVGWSVVIGVFAVWVAGAFGFGPLGREMTDAAKRDEQESWRN